MAQRRGSGWSGLLNYGAYRGQVGQWAQILHRLTGLGIIGFLLLHVLDTALVGFGPEAYNTVTQLYHNPVVRVLEVVLVGVVIYHSLNGLRVTLVDISDWGTLHQKELFLAAVVVFLILFIPAGILMMASLP